MILYRAQRRDAEFPQPPAWLEAAVDLSFAETGTHRIMALGPTYLVGERKGLAWVAIEDGWQAALLQPDEPMAHARKISWARTRLVADAEGRQWQVPVVRSIHGASAIIASYGANWLPAYTEQQQRLLAISDAAAAALEARQLPQREGCQWAAELLLAGHHISLMTIQGLRLLDDYLVQNVLAAATGIFDAQEAAQAVGAS